MSDNCGNCRYWLRDVSRKDLEGTQVMGGCRRYPPTGPRVVPNGPRSLSGVHTFPATLAVDWCGEFASATAAPKPDRMPVKVAAMDLPGVDYSDPGKLGAFVTLQNRVSDDLEQFLGPKIGVAVERVDVDEAVFDGSTHNEIDLLAPRRGELKITAKWWRKK